MNINEYFPKEDGIANRLGRDTGTILTTIANRFMADHPPVPVQYYLRSKQNFSVSEDYLEEIKFHQVFPDMVPETYAYAWAKLTPPQPGPFHFRFSAYGPVRIYVNGTLAFRTNHVQERFVHEISDICLGLEEGCNSLVVECMSTPLGCGFRIGSSSYKGRRIQFFAPSKEHHGMSGMIYTTPMNHPMEQIPQIGESLEERDEIWLPSLSWTAKEKKEGLSQRLFGDVEEHPYITAGMLNLCGKEQITLEGTVSSNTTLFVEEMAYELKKGIFSLDISLEGGAHKLAFFGGDISVEIKGRMGDLLPVIPPVVIQSTLPITWIYAGPFAQVPDMKMLLQVKAPFETINGLDFWRVDLPGVYLRPMNEGVLYGEWNYPLGVTLYGMIQSARLMNHGPLNAYVKGHMEKCVDFYPYCMWDKETYGAAPFHNQLTTIDSLDDCGSFASAMLEVMKDSTLSGGDLIADMVADYMMHKQQRLVDGTFYRNHSYLPVMNETMWADDLYMSIPFLCRYYERTGQEVYLEDAMMQAENFYRYLYMPELQIMSHIYDTGYQLQTKVPWGRGNGWVIFSLTELLAVIPKKHPKREGILAIFRQLSKGYLNLQGASGMWHQVLTMPESYEETSCSAMFVYGFSRGVRYGWFLDPEAYEAASTRGWNALCEKAVDWKGNIYGVCRGSGYSFSKEYYAHDLSWNINDTHGTGIVMLAGIEVEKMRKRGEKNNENGI